MEATKNFKFKKGDDSFGLPGHVNGLVSFEHFYNLYENLFCEF